jgi:hypothetical protein
LGCNCVLRMEDQQTILFGSDELQNLHSTRPERVRREGKGWG